MRRIDIWDFLRLDFPPMEHRIIASIRGTNGSGKSTIPWLMIQDDPDTFEVVEPGIRKYRVLATVSPKHRFMIVGAYPNLLGGGVDKIPQTERITDIVKILWDLPFHVIIEGFMLSSVRTLWIELFKELNQTHSHRDVIFYSLLPPLEVCLQRVMQRNGSKQIAEEFHKKKWRAVNNNVKRFQEAGFTSLAVDNTTFPKEQALNHFFDLCEEHTQARFKRIDAHPTEENVKPLEANIEKATIETPPEQTIESVEYYVEPEDNLKQYDWYPDYKAPDRSMVIDKKYFDQYWYFITERMNIWYKRVVLGEPAPWTDDPILQNFKFTNVLRDLDRLSLYERKHILSRIDDIQDDWSPERVLKWKQSIILNIMVFRLWVKIDTYEVHGFIDLTDSNWRAKWDAAKPMLLKRREDGIPNFTAAYFVSDLQAVNPDPATKRNKTASAIAMIDSWISNIDYIFDHAVVKAHDMKEQMAFFKTLTCVGAFTAYEYACSIAEMTRYCKNHMVEWTQDSATNVGPGAHRGINWIFKNKGGMSDYQAILYLRSIWKHELQLRGTYNKFINQLPKEMKGDIDLRVIEHCLCECQKYNKAWTGTGRPKEAFRPKTIEDLVESMV